MASMDASTDEAETLALKALEFVIADQELQNQFLSSSGMSAKAIHDSIQDTSFLGGVLGFLLGRETDLVRFCEKYQIDPAKPSNARDTLENLGNTTSEE